MPRVTLKQIAAQAKVSVATASMALRGQGKLAEKTVSRVRAIAEELGYRPDPTLASLASRRFRSGDDAQGLPLALLEFPPFLSKSNEARNLYRFQLMESARRLGYAPTVYSVAEMESYQDFTRVLYHRGTVGVVITGQSPPGLFDNQTRWEPFALAQCGRYRNITPLHTVRPNIFQAIKLSFEQAYMRGYRRIGFALGSHPEILEDDLARLGAARALIDNWLPKDARIAPYFGPIHSSGEMAAWALKSKADAFVAFSSGFWFTLRDAGIRCPEDVGFISMHLHSNEHPPIPFSGLDQSRGEIAKQTVLLIDQMVRHNERGLPEQARNLLIHSAWIEGNTLPERTRGASPSETKPKGEGSPQAPLK